MTTTKKPHVILNCAMSVDGKIALPTRAQTRISSPEDIRRVYELRNSCDAILVGINTILSDDPKLTVKEKYVPNPVNPTRVILDSKCRTPEGALVLDGKAPTIIAVRKEYCRELQGAEVIPVEAPENEDDGIHLPKLLEILSEKGVKRLLVEGGESVIWSFLKERLADELFVYIGSIVIGGTHSPTMAGGEGVQRLEDIISLTLLGTEKLGDGVLLHYNLDV